MGFNSGFKGLNVHCCPHLIPSKTMYEDRSESKERFAIQRYLLIIGKKQNMQVLSHTFTYFSTFSPWTLRHLSYRDTSLLIPSSYQTVAWLFNQSMTACCMMHSIGTHLTILPAVRTWHHRTFTSFRRWRSTLLVNDLQMMRTYSMLSWTAWIARRPSGTRRE